VYVPDIFTLDTLRYAVTLTFNSLTLNVCIGCGSVSNFCEIEQSAAELLRSEGWNYGAVSHLGFDGPEVNFTISQPSVRGATVNQHVKLQRNWGMRGWVIDDLSKSSLFDFKGSNSGRFAGVREPNSTQFGETYVSHQCSPDLF